MTSEQTAQIFREYLTRLGYSKGSVYMLPNCIKEFLDYYHPTEIQNFSQQHINQFYEWLHIRPNKLSGGALSEMMIGHFIYSLKVFFNYLEETGQISFNPISVMKFKAPKSNPRQPLTQEEIQALFESTDKLKEKAILHLFYSCGLRRSEGKALNINDIHFKKQLLFVREGKGTKRRVIPMTVKVTTDLENYYLLERTNIKAHHSLSRSDSGNQEAFILNRTGRRMSGDGYNKVLKEIIRKAGITKEATLHHLRHSIATHLLENGLSLEYVRDFLGHSHLEATQIYAKVQQYQLRKL